MSGIRINWVSGSRLIVIVKTPVAAPSKTWVYVCVLGGIAGSIPAGEMDVSCECCQVEVFAAGRSFVQSSPTDCVSLRVIRCKNNPLHLQRFSTRDED